MLPASLHVTLCVHTVAPGSDIMSGNGKTIGPHGKFPCGPRRWCSWGQTALPAVHWLQDMFQPFRPLSGAMVLSGEPLTVTTSPMRELS